MSKKQSLEEPIDETNGAEKRATQAKDTFVTDFQDRSALVKVWLCPGRDGTKYLKATIHHLYKAEQSGKWQSPKHFFASNEDRVIPLIRQASAFIKAHNEDPESALDTIEREKAESPEEQDAGEQEFDSMQDSTHLAPEALAD